MSRQHFTYQSDEQFTCSHCGMLILPAQSGTRNRNHCPYCLHSLHADLRIGDRKSRCRGTMSPIGIWVQEKGEWSIIHRCNTCGWIRTNRIAPDDNEELLLELVLQPLEKPAFPWLISPGYKLENRSATPSSISTTKSVKVKQ